MKIERIVISEVPSYKPLAGSYEGEIKFVGSHGTIEVQLDAALCATVLKVCADSLVKATKELAQNMTSEVFESASNNLLAAPQDE